MEIFYCYRKVLSLTPALAAPSGSSDLLPSNRKLTREEQEEEKTRHDGEEICRSFEKNPREDWRRIDLAASSPWVDPSGEREKEANSTHPFPSTPLVSFSTTTEAEDIQLAYPPPLPLNSVRHTCGTPGHPNGQTERERDGDCPENRHRQTSTCTGGVHTPGDTGRYTAG